MRRPRHFVVGAAEAGKRLDQAVATALPDLSRGEARRLIDQGAVYLERRRHKRASTPLELGQRVEVYAEVAAGAPSTPGTRATRPASSAPAATGATTAASATPRLPRRPAAEVPALTLVYEDESIVVVEKPAGVASQARREGDAGTVPWLLLRQFRAAGERRPYLAVVHRLDQPASGLLLLARTRAAAARLSADFREHLPLRSYLAVTRGAPAEDEQLVDLPLDTRGPTVRVDRAAGQPARTRVRVLERHGDLALVRAELETGRMHQVRVHLASLGSPIAGDRRYGGGPAPVPAGEAERLGLHATALTFRHPKTGAPLTFESPLPAALRAWLARAS